MSAVDDFSTYQIPLNDPYPNAAAVTPSDSVDLTDVTRAVYVGGAGALTVTMQGQADGSNVAFAAVPAGTTIRIRAKRIWATGTAATSIVALW